MRRAAGTCRLSRYVWVLFVCPNCCFQLFDVLLGTSRYLVRWFQVYCLALRLPSGSSERKHEKGRTVCAWVPLLLGVPPALCCLLPLPFASAHTLRSNSHRSFSPQRLKEKRQVHGCTLQQRPVSATLSAVCTACVSLCAL